MRNIYDEVTQRVLDMIDTEGKLPWQRPWIGIGMTWNRITEKPYSLFNQILLGKPGEWATYKQWESEGAYVKQGEKCCKICFYTVMPVKAVIDKNSEEVFTIKEIPVLKTYAVFHISQVEGNGIKPKREVTGYTHERLDEAEKAVKEYAVREMLPIHYDECINKCFYRTSTHEVTCVPLNRFKEQPEYYSTLFHELVHSTARTLKRKIKNSFGNTEYAKEELVAEMGAAFLCNHFGIINNTIKNTAAYLKSWRDVIAKDNKLIISAAGQAEKAVKYILFGELPNNKKNND